MTEDERKALGDFELVKPLTLMPGWAALIGRFQRQSAEYKERLTLALDALLYNDSEKNRETWHKLRIEALAIEGALNIYLDIEHQAKAVLADIEDARVLEGEGTPRIP